MLKNISWVYDPNSLETTAMDPSFLARITHVWPPSCSGLFPQPALPVVSLFPPRINILQPFSAWALKVRKGRCYFLPMITARGPILPLPGPHPTAPPPSPDTCCFLEAEAIRVSLRATDQVQFPASVALNLPTSWAISHGSWSPTWAPCLCSPWGRP